MRSQRFSFLLWLATAAAQIPELFQTLDANADGFLSRDELRTYSQSAIGPDGQPLDLAGQTAHFDGIDANSDNIISFEEFQEAAALASGGGNGVQDASSAAEQILNHFDSDHDGRLNQDELAGFFSASHGLSMEMLDADEDTFVTQEELIYAMRTMAGQSFS